MPTQAAFFNAVASVPPVLCTHKGWLNWLGRMQKRWRTDTLDTAVSKSGHHELETWTTPRNTTQRKHQASWVLGMKSPRASMTTRSWCRLQSQKPGFVSEQHWPYNITMQTTLQPRMANQPTLQWNPVIYWMHLFAFQFTWSKILLLTSPSCLIRNITLPPVYLHACLKKTCSGIASSKKS